MSIISLIVGFILGAISTLIFTLTLKNTSKSVENEIIEKGSKLNPTIGLFILVPILAGLVYWKVGSPNAVSVTSPETAITSIDGMATMPIGDGHEIGDLAAMAEKLAAKLEKKS